MPRRSIRRPAAMPTHLPFVAQRWHTETSSILATARQVAEGLFKLKSRADIPETPINVAALLLMRLEDMRDDSLGRARLALMAIAQGDFTRAQAELNAIAQNLEAQRPGGYHGVRVTTDMRSYGSRLVT